MNNRPAKVIILTLPLGNNYGGLMQAYALQRVVSELGYEVVTDRYACRNKTWKELLLGVFLPAKNKLLEMLGNRVSVSDNNILRNKYLQNFINENIRSVDFFRNHSRPIKNDVDKYDVFLVGSDQVWRKKYVNVQSYLLSFLNHNLEKVFLSYAASFGCDNIDDWTKADKKVAKRMLPQFAAISVREKSGIDILKKQFGIQSTCVLDPTMLLKRDDYLNLDGINKIEKRKKMLYCYILDFTEEKEAMINFIREKRGLNNILFISPKIDKFKKNLPSDYTYPSIAEWLSGFRDADYVFTDSFHGSVFSLLFGKQFVCFVNKTRGATRIESLFEMFNITDRLISSVHEYEEVSSSNIDYETVYSILEEKRKMSLDFLKIALLNYK